MGIFYDLYGGKGIPPGRVEEYVRQGMRVLREGGMMCVSSATLFGKEIHLLSFPSFDKDGRFAFCYNYFENDFWEDACLTADGGFWSNKVGGRFASVILAMYTLQEFYDEGFCLPDIDGRIGACGPVIGWLNHVLNERFANTKTLYPMSVLTAIYKTCTERYGYSREKWEKRVKELREPVLYMTNLDLVNVDSAVAFSLVTALEECEAGVAVGEQGENATFIQTYQRLAECALRLKAQSHSTDRLLERLKSVLLLPLKERLKSYSVFEKQKGDDFSRFLFLSAMLPEEACLKAIADAFSYDAWALISWWVDITGRRGHSFIGERQILIRRFPLCRRYRRKNFSIAPAMTGLPSGQRLAIYASPIRWSTGWSP